MPSSDPALPEDLGRRIRQVRLRRGLYPRDLAAQVGCTAKHLNNLEADRKKPGLVLLHRIVTALRVEVDDLVAPAFDVEALLRTASASTTAGAA